MKWPGSPSTVAASHCILETKLGSYPVIATPRMRWSDAAARITGSVSSPKPTTDQAVDRKFLALCQVIHGSAEVEAPSPASGWPNRT